MMNYHVLLVTLCALIHSVTALRLNVAQAKRPVTHSRIHSPKVAAANQNNELDLDTVHDLIYLTNVTVAGTSYSVQLDTGSSDLWIKGATSPLPRAKETTISYNLTYGIGWAFGHVAYAPVDFAGITIPSQAFLDVSKVYNPALGYGADGILGLGFTSLSTVDALVNATGSSDGRSLLFNLFQSNPSEPNFIAISLQRSTQAGSDVEGSFAIGEYEPAYADVANKPQIPTWPVNSPKRWNVLVDAVLIGSNSVIPTSTVAGAPSNKAVALLDSGTSYTYAPKEICDAIYSTVSGANFDSDLGQWIVPCTAEIDIALQIGGQILPMHPLDLTPNGLTDKTTCVGSFVPGSVAVGAGEFDWLIGDNFLRSVYSVYDFGDFNSDNVMGNPYVKMLPLVNPDKASKEFATARGSTAKTGITYNAAGDSPGSTVPGGLSVTTDVTSILDKISTYLPIMLAIMGLNALVIIILIAVGVVLLCRKRRKSARTRLPQSRASPAVADPRNSYVAGSVRQTSETHQYQPVSVTVPEDNVFGPPSPGFKKFDGERPKSTGTRPASSLYQTVGSEDALFSPSAAPVGTSSVRPTSVISTARSQQDSLRPAPEDQPFTPPAIGLGSAVPADKASIRSARSSRHSPMDERPSVEGSDEPQSPLESATVPLLQPPPTVIVPLPSPDILDILTSESDIGQSIQAVDESAQMVQPLVPSQPAASMAPPVPVLAQIPSPSSPHSPEIRSAPPMPPPFRRPVGVSLVDRPMSTVILPSQSQQQYPSYSRPLRSALRPNPSNSPRPMSANVPMLDVSEEDITSIPPRAPFLRRSPLSKSSTDRPSSMA